MRTFQHSLGIFLLAATSVGCGSGDKAVPVSGVVTLDGKPAAGAPVMFTPTSPGQPAIGVADDSGKFSLSTPSGTQKIPIGSYRVSVRHVKVSGIVSKDGLSGEVQPGGLKEEWITPKRYGDPKTSGIEIEVKPGMGPVKLELVTE